MDLQLNGKRALVTGASRGLGYAVALGLAKEGCHVALNSRNAENASRAADTIHKQTGNPVFTAPGDVSNASDITKIVEQAVKTLGGLDILMTNSGGPPAGAFESFDDDAWLSAIELVFMSHMRLIRAALPHLRQSKTASVLTLTSYSVKQPIPGLVLSNSIRSATVGLTKTLALELGSEGIRFNSVLPGWTDTERVQYLMEQRAKTNKTTVEDEIAKQMKDSPLGRMATPQEFANVAVFLISPAASYITGLMLTVDGGMVKSTL
ncbi:MAG: SDR family oxidoreductase [Anaerolineales bacterium]|nr:SDR family oxidoreductase [Anaerolineales bacterium]